MQTRHGITLAALTISALLLLPTQLAATSAHAAGPAAGSALTVQAPERRCVIKGNVTNSGEKIYHVPGQRYYKATKISFKRGERWFCSEREARRAGWRKSKI